jgi:hypothetical protein
VVKARRYRFCKEQIDPFNILHNMIEND